MHDPNAAGPNADRWEATVPGAPSRALAMALTVLRDSDYAIAKSASNVANGLLVTIPRRESEAQRGTQQLNTLRRGSNYPVMLRVLVLPVGTDSARVSISGEYLMDNTRAPQRIDVHMDEWRFVAGIGAAIAEELRLLDARSRGGAPLRK